MVELVCLIPVEFTGLEINFELRASITEGISIDVSVALLIYWSGFLATMRILAELLPNWPLLKGFCGL